MELFLIFMGGALIVVAAALLVIAIIVMVTDKLQMPSKLATPIPPPTPPQKDPMTYTYEVRGEVPRDDEDDEDEDDEDDGDDEVDDEVDEDDEVDAIAEKERVQAVNDTTIKLTGEQLAIWAKARRLVSRKSELEQLLETVTGDLTKLQHECKHDRPNDEYHSRSCAEDDSYWTCRICGAKYDSEGLI